MDDGSWILYFLLVFFILGGSYFASTEIAFAAANKIRIRNKAENGDKRAKKALYIINHFDKALTTLLIGNNIMHIGASSVATLLALRLWGESAVATTTLVMTIIVFLISEMIPKSFAKSRSDAYAMTVASSLRFLMRILTPVSIFFTAISKGVSRLFASKPRPTVTEEELKEIIETIDEEGSLPADKTELVQSALEFGDITVQDVLTPRVDVVALDIDCNPEETLEMIRGNKHSRIPVYKEGMDDVIGVLQIRKYLKNHIKSGKADVRELMDAPFFVPMTTKVDDLMEEMSRKKIHMAVVRDEYGGTLGLVTMEDILEELVGEIWDEDDEVVEELMPLGGNRFEVSADLLILDALSAMDCDCTESEESEMEHMTVGAWALVQFADTMPQEDDCFVWKNLKVCIKHIDNQRITKLLFKPNREDAE